MRPDEVAKRLKTYRRSVVDSTAIVIACLCVQGCVSGPIVVEEYDDQCRFIEPIYQVASDEKSAIKKMREQVISVNGDTLFFGEPPYKYVAAYDEKRAKEYRDEIWKKCSPNCPMDVFHGGAVAQKIAIPPGHKNYFGAVLFCGSGN